MNPDDQIEEGKDREAQALLQILALGEKQVEAGKVYPPADAISFIRARQATRERATQKE